MSQFSRGINAIDRYLRRLRRQYMEPEGLKGIHARLIMAISRTPGCSQDQLSRRMWFDKSTIARQLEILENKGFITRIPSQTDKRVLCVYPTQKLLDFQPGLKSAMEEWERELLSDLSENEKEQLNSLLTKLHSKISREE